MATAVIMPRQGQSVESCLIGKWYKIKGDKVSVGDVLFSYETDKAAFEEEAQVEGVLLDVFFEEGDDVECLINVCVIGAEGESVEEFRPSGGGSGITSVSGSGGDSNNNTTDNSAANIPVSDSEFNPSSVSGNVKQLSDNVSQSAVGFSRDPNERLKISPRARILAEKTKADLNFAVPSGANGRIIERDVQAVLSQGLRGNVGSDTSVTVQKQIADNTKRTRQQSGEDFKTVPLSNVRKFIAKAMHASLSNSAQLTSHSSFDASDVFDLRKKLKAMEEYPDLGKITITDIIVYAASRVLLDHKYINSHFLGDKMNIFNNAHIGVAVDTPRGLLVPTIFNANAMSLSEISAHAKELFEKCKQGSIEPDLLKGASFTISNLGGLGVEMFTPILNPPQTGILGVCNTIERTKNGKPYPALGLSVTYDHQAMDGADSARFLRDLVMYLESFTSQLLLEGGLM